MADRSVLGSRPGREQRAIPLGPVGAWRDALTGRPARLVRNPRAEAGQAYTWVFLAGLIAVALRVAAEPVGAVPALDGERLASLPLLLCGLPVGALGITLLFALYAGGTHGLGRLLGGTGRHDRLAYGLGAAFAPLILLAAILASSAVLVYGLVLVALYAVVYAALVVRAVYGLDWPRAAAASLWLPVIVALLVAWIALTGPVTIRF